MTQMTCPQCRHYAAELALDILPEPVRTRALAHLDSCTTCRNTVSALIFTAAQLIELLPEAQPSAGFEHRVISALTIQRRSLQNGVTR